MLSEYDQKEARDEAIFNAVLQASRELFPAQTAKAEEWLQQRLLQYGIIYAKGQIQEKIAKAEPVVKNPWLWLGAGALVGWMILRK